ncbi:MAG TPA: Rne/Rng family ribonuclease [Gaiellaceae bacterium]|nr:Rne/Rng family ribonuclease [Gaiellaceae bacterium]
MPLSWFRRKRNEPEQAPAPQAAAPAPLPDVTTTPATAGGEQPSTTDPTRPKRRRGTRGGKGRKKTGTASTAATASKTEPKPRESKGREPKEKKEEVRSQRRERRANQPRRRVPQKRPQLPPAKRELLVSVDVGEQRVAILEDDRVAEVYLERPERRSIAGNIYLGTVDNVLPGMEAAFVEIGLEKNGFLYVDEIVVPELEGKGQGRRIQDLIKRGEQVLVQAVKDPMKSKGARLTTEISLPGRFVVYVPLGEGLGVSRRLEDDERARLKEIVKGLKLKQGGVIVRTAAEGASAEDVERDLLFLQKLWKSIQDRAKNATPPTLVYQESELPLRVTRDLFTGDFERALVDDDTAYKRIVGYLKKTSPHMVEKVQRFKEKTPLFESFGVDDEIRSTLRRRVDLPSGGYLIFDYAEAFTVVDVNTGRFVGSRSKSSGARLEDTITKNNLEAVKEVVRQLRLRDIGGIIVIDFIDMANPSNRATVEAALRTELERDRTKTYVVEISPLGLVEMTRQNVTDGPREILTKKCPTCEGDGIGVSESTAAVDLERRLRALAASKPRTKAFRVEVAAKPGSMLIGPGASRLEDIEASTKRRFFLELKDGIHNDHFSVVGEGTIEKLRPEAPVEEGAEVELKLVEVGLYDPTAAVAKVDGLAVTVAGASKLVGKKVPVRVNRVLNGTAYATLLDQTVVEAPITAEREAEKPTRTSRAKAAPKPKEQAVEEPAEETPVEAVAAEDEAEAENEAEAEVDADADVAAEPKPKKKTRRGSRGGRRRRKTGTAATNGGAGAAADDGPRIHLPDRSLESEPEQEPQAEAVAAESNGAESAAEGDAEPKPKKKTRRGSRGGRRRRKTATAATPGGDAPEPTETPA